MQNSLLCSMNQSATIFYLWPGALSCWKWIPKDVHNVVINWGMWLAITPRWAVHLKNLLLVERVPMYAKKIFSIPFTTTTLNHWYKVRWIHTYVLFMPNFSLLSECHSRNWDSSNQAMYFFFHSSIVQFLWSLMNYSFSFLLLHERSSSQLSLLLLYVKVQCRVFSEMLFYILSL